MGVFRHLQKLVESGQPLILRQFGRFGRMKDGNMNSQLSDEVKYRTRNIVEFFPF